jgi:hypothetical protein
VDTARIRIELDPDGVAGPLPFLAAAEVLVEGMDVDVDSNNDGAIDASDEKDYPRARFCNS